MSYLRFLAPFAFLAVTTAVHADAIKINGFALPAWQKGAYVEANHTELALDELKEIGAGWISIHSTYYQDGVTGTDIHTQNPKGDTTASIEELRSVIQAAHKRGIRVMVKPHVDLTTRDGWRGDIGAGMTEEQRAAWFKSYGEMILEQARLAESESADLFSIGTELSSLQDYEEQWRDLVKAVRGVYRGPIVYCVNHGTEMQFKWWDAVDFIGIDAYFPLGQDKDATLPDLLQAWQPIALRLQALSQRENRQIIFTEIGYTSRDGTVLTPWEWLLKTEADFQEQADAYEAFFRGVYTQPWFRGVFFWRWDLDPETAGTDDLDFMVEGKPAGDVVKNWFTSKAEKSCCQ